MNVHSYSSVLKVLSDRMREKPPGLIQVLSGPRQTGKTTLLLELQKQLGERCIYAAGDAPESSLQGWWENLWQNTERLAEKGKAFLLIDEIQYIPDWSRLLKGRFDRIRRTGLRLQIVISSSSALHVGRGTKESLAGRFEKHSLRHWLPTELVERFAIDRSEVSEWFLKNGSFPGSVKLTTDRQRWIRYISDAIIEPAIGKDILLTETVRKPALLRQLFAVCIGHPAEIISLQKICGHLSEKGSQQTVADYLFLLEEAGLIAGIQKYSWNVIRERKSPPKIVVLNQALLSAGTNMNAPERDREPERFGHWVENACLSFAWNSGQTVRYWRQEPFEVDMISDGSWGHWAVEVKTGNVILNDLRGLLEFCGAEKTYRPLLICAKGLEKTGRDAGISTMNWQDFLLNGPPRK